MCPNLPLGYQARRRPPAWPRSRRPRTCRNARRTSLAPPTAIAATPSQRHTTPSWCQSLSTHFFINSLTAGEKLSVSLCACTLCSSSSYGSGANSSSGSPVFAAPPPPVAGVYLCAQPHPEVSRPDGKRGMRSLPAGTVSRGRRTKTHRPLPRPLPLLPLLPPNLLQPVLQLDLPRVQLLQDALHLLLHHPLGLVLPAEAVVHRLTRARDDLGLGVGTEVGQEG